MPKILNQFIKERRITDPALLALLSEYDRWRISLYNSGRKPNPSSINQRAKDLGISRQALWAKEKRAKKKDQQARGSSWGLAPLS